MLFTILFPTCCHGSGIEIDVNEVQCENAFFPIDITNVGITNDFIECFIRRLQISSLIRVPKNSISESSKLSFPDDLLSDYKDTSHAKYSGIDAYIHAIS